MSVIGFVRLSCRPKQRSDQSREFKMHLTCGVNVAKPKSRIEALVFSAGRFPIDKTIASDTRNVIVYINIDPLDLFIVFKEREVGICLGRRISMTEFAKRTTRA